MPEAAAARLCSPSRRWRGPRARRRPYWRSRSRGCEGHLWMCAAPFLHVRAASCLGVVGAVDDPLYGAVLACLEKGLASQKRRRSDAPVVARCARTGWGAALYWWRVRWRTGSGGFKCICGGGGRWGSVPVCVLHDGAVPEPLVDALCHRDARRGVWRRARPEVGGYPAPVFDLPGRGVKTAAAAVTAPSPRTGARARRLSSKTSAARPDAREVRKYTRAASAARARVNAALE